MDTVRKEPPYTSDEFLAMTELEGRHELIGGYICDMSPAPNILHQKVSSGMTTEIVNYIKSHKGRCSVFAAPTDVKLDDENTVQPDIFVVCDPDKLDKQKCNGAPDWVIEILSESSVYHDTVEKLALYSRAGVKEYWREPLKTHLREKELLAPTASSSLLTLRGLPGSGEVSSLRDRGADRQASKLSEPFLAFGPEQDALTMPPEERKDALLKAA